MLRKTLIWLLRLALFILLFAFALNNQHEVQVHWLMGVQWRSPMIFVVLVSFALGCALGILTLLPAWWRDRQHTQRATASPRSASPTPRESDPNALPEQPATTPDDGR